MRMHETLFFIQGLHDYFESIGAGEGDGSWPVREHLAENIAANIDVVGKNALPDLRRQMAIARGRGWMVEERCNPDCHARHVRLTATGREALRLMNELGCCPACGNPKETKGYIRDCMTNSFKFTGKLAA